MKRKLCPVVVTAPARENLGKSMQGGRTPFSCCCAHGGAVLFLGNSLAVHVCSVFPFFVPQLVVKHAPCLSSNGGDGKEVVTFVILIFVFFGAEKCIVIFCRSAACRRPYVLPQNVVLFANFTLLTNTYVNTITQSGRLVHTVVSHSRIAVNFYSLSWPGPTTGFLLASVYPHQTFSICWCPSSIVERILLFLSTNMCDFPSVCV